MNNSLHLAIISLRITAVLYWLLGIGLILLPFVGLGFQFFFNGNLTIFPTLGLLGNFTVITLYCWLAALLALGPAVFLEFIIRDLKRYKYWAWIAGLIMCGIYVPSGFIIFGILGLVGLLNRDVTNEFNRQRQNKIVVSTISIPSRN